LGQLSVGEAHSAAAHRRDDDLSKELQYNLELRGEAVLAWDAEVYV